MNRLLSNNGIMMLMILLNLGLAIFATPIAEWGDPPEYILLSQSILGQDTDVNMAHRSPLYSLLLAGLMLFLKSPLLYKVAIFIQYVLLAFTSWMTYHLFCRKFSKKIWALLSALVFNLSLATIYFANMLQTEILTVFLMVLSVVILMKIYDTGKFIHYLSLGLVVGLLSLARFSAVPLILTYFILLLIVLYRQKVPIKEWVWSLVLFLLPYSLIINGWCFYNQYNNGFYGLFPHSGQGVSRNITIASIRPETVVSEINKPVLEIFNEARKTYLATPRTSFKGSLAKFDKFDILNDLYGGYAIYLEATPELRQHFKLPKSSGEYELNQNLSSIYQEISHQNQAFVFRFRVISFLNGFRVAESGSLPPEFGKINLNILPHFIFKIYRLAFVFISLFVFLSFFFFVVKGIKNEWYFDFTLLAMFFILFSFWGINFVFVTAADANRFKFPAEPFIFGLFIYYVLKSWQWLTNRRQSGQEITIDSEATSA